MKKQKIFKFLSILLVFAIIIGAFTACGKDEDKSKDIYIVFTGDIHCADDENIGFAGLASYYDQIKAKSKNTLLVDTGDAIQGDYCGAVTNGEYIIELMNDVGYDIAVLGNHEFGYSMEILSNLIEKANADYVGCNIEYTGSKENPLKDLKPYIIKTFDNVKVGFVGVTTPTSKTTSIPVNFKENDEFVYDFAEGEEGKVLIDKVQKNVNACRANGADYVIVLTHLGDTEEYPFYNSRKLIASTNGIDAVLDGHAHNEISCDILHNKDKQEVILSTTGTKLDNIGTLVITEEGDISVRMISDYVNKKQSIKEKIDLFNAEQDEKLTQKIIESDFAMSIHENGVRIVRTSETTIGNMLADAFRKEGNTDIAILNGGGVRTSLNVGAITYGDVMAVMPFQNSLCTVKAKGSEIADAIEFGCRVVKQQTSDENGVIGENGGFLQVSGIRFKVDTSIESTVKVDGIDAFIEISGERRVKDIEVLNSDGTYSPIDLEKTYTVASINYILFQEGDGYNMFSDNEFIIADGKMDYQIIVEYLQQMGKKVSDKYEKTEDRITILGR